MVELNSPLLGNLILSLHLLFLEFSDIPHSNLLTEFNKHLVLHLQNNTFAWIFLQYNKCVTDSFLNKFITWFIRSRRSLISLSRDWMILLMSLMRGPKLANSLSNLDFSCETKETSLNTTAPTSSTEGGAGVWPDYLHVEGQVASFCLLQITLGVLESHLKTVSLRLNLTQLCLLPLGLHLLLQSKWIKQKCCGFM